MGGRQRTFFRRTFGKMEQGSVRGSVFALCAVAIGAGVLSLPYVLAMCGWVLGTILIIIGAVTGYLSMYIIIVRSIENNCKNYSQLSHLAGGRGLTIFLQISILSFMFGACLSYQIISKSYILISFSHSLVRDRLQPVRSFQRYHWGFRVWSYPIQSFAVCDYYCMHYLSPLAC